MSSATDIQDPAALAAENARLRGELDETIAILNGTTAELVQALTLLAFGDDAGISAFELLVNNGYVNPEDGQEAYPDPRYFRQTVAVLQVDRMRLLNGLAQQNAGGGLVPALLAIRQSLTGESDHCGLCGSKICSGSPAGCSLPNGPNGQKGGRCMMHEPGDLAGPHEWTIPASGDRFWCPGGSDPSVTAAAPNLKAA